MSIIAIDPGYAKRGRGCACARFDGDDFLAAWWYARPDAMPPDGAWPEADTVVWECPQVDGRTRTATPQAVQLAAVGGTLAGLYAGHAGATVDPVTPSAWKGSTPKPIQHMRMWEVLTPPERALLGGSATEAAIDAARRKGALDRWSKSGAAYYPHNFLMHNILDAVGIGVWWLGR